MPGRPPYVPLQPDPVAGDHRIDSPAAEECVCATSSSPTEGPRTPCCVDGARLQGQQEPPSPASVPSLCVCGGGGRLQHQVGQLWPGDLGAVLRGGRPTQVPTCSPHSPFGASSLLGLVVCPRGVVPFPMLVAPSVFFILLLTRSRPWKRLSGHLLVLRLVSVRHLPPWTVLLRQALVPCRLSLPWVGSPLRCAEACTWMRSHLSVSLVTCAFTFLSKAPPHTGRPPPALLCTCAFPALPDLHFLEALPRGPRWGPEQAGQVPLPPLCFLGHPGVAVSSWLQTPGNPPAIILGSCGQPVSGSNNAVGWHRKLAPLCWHPPWPRHIQLGFSSLCPARGMKSCPFARSGKFPGCWLGLAEEPLTLGDEHV